MVDVKESGRIIVLNGVPRSGKSSIAAAIQDGFEGVWINLGVDSSVASLPERFRPGMGLRPGGERPDLEPLVVSQYAALYESIAAHSRLGLNVVADVGHHESYSERLGILPACARLLTGLTGWFVGVRCSAEIVKARRQATGYPTDPDKILRWEAVHALGIYDLQVDTSASTPQSCAEAVCDRLQTPPEAFSKLAALP